MEKAGNSGKLGVKNRGRNIFIETGLGRQRGGGPEVDRKTRCNRVIGPEEGMVNGEVEFPGLIRNKGNSPGPCCSKSSPMTTKGPVREPLQQ